MNREIRIDIVRGIAMLTILLNHFAMAFRAMGYRGWEIPTPTQLGYSSAASIFVALSGYMVGMVYMRREHPMRAVLKRAWQLYLVNVAIFILVSPAIWAANPATDRFWNMQIFLRDPARGLLDFLTLRNAPAFLDVLQLYIVLLAVTPLAILLVRRSAWLLAGCSLAVWGVIQFWPFVLPASLPVPHLGRSLNPFAWQMCFFLPMIAGMKRWHVPVFAWLGRNGWAVALVIGALLIFTYLHQIDRPFASWKVHLALTNRFVHGPIWTLHALLLLVGYLGLLVWLTPWLKALPFQLLERLGRNSLNVYASSIPVIFAIGFAVASVRLDQPGYVFGSLVTVALCLAVAFWSDWRKKRRRSEPPSAAPQPA